MTTTVRLLSSALLFTAALAAQTVVVRGELVSGRATGCYYCPNVQFAIKYTEMPVHSATINLAVFLDQQVELIGTWNGSATAPTLDVTAAQLVPEMLSFSGPLRIGARMRLTIAGTAGDSAIQVAALDRRFGNPFGTLAFLLDPSTAFVTGVGVLGNTGEFRSETDIPNVPALVGLHVFAQALVIPPAALPYTTNPRADFVQS